MLETIHNTIFTLLMTNDLTKINITNRLYPTIVEKNLLFAH